MGRIGPWQLVRLLHESELARVYLARPADSEKEQSANYVVKMLRKEWWRDTQSIEMQRRATWLGQKLSHPHLLPVLSANVRQAPFYFVSPKIEGVSLATVLGKEGDSRVQHLSLPVMLWIVRQVAEALSALHEEADMIHSDVKPSNILVSNDGAYNLD